jgi:hypothetical protein
VVTSYHVYEGNRIYAFLAAELFWPIHCLQFPNDPVLFLVHNVFHRTVSDGTHCRISLSPFCGRAELCLFSTIRVLKGIPVCPICFPFIFSLATAQAYVIFNPLQKIPSCPCNGRVAVLHNASLREHKREHRKIIVHSVCMHSQCPTFNIFDIYEKVHKEFAYLVFL